MGIDKLKFEAEADLPQPDRQITVMGWTDDTHSFSAKPYLPFLSDISQFSIGINERHMLSSEELLTLSEQVDAFEFEGSGYDPSSEQPTDPERTVPKNAPSTERNTYSRGPNSEQEVADLAYLFDLYGSNGATLVYLF